MRRFLLLASMALTGCVIVDPTPAGCEAPTSLNGWLIYRVRANAGTDIPSGDAAYAVTANATGGYTVAWSDRTGSNVNAFSGTLQASAGFDPTQTQRLSGAEQITVGASSIGFSSVPGTRIDGLSVVTLSDPLFVDARLNSAAAPSIYYTDYLTGRLCVVAGPGAFQPR
jgi:hypothetical protein